MKYFLLFLISLLLASCDVSLLLSVDNHRSNPCLAKIEFRGGHAYFDSDSLRYEGLEDTSIHGILIRENMTDSSYLVEVPANCRVMLLPRSLGTPITFVEVTDLKDTLACCRSHEEFKEMKAAGFIRKKGLYRVKYEFR